MSESKKATGQKAIADVAHPGKSAPSDTSKPIITHRPMMKDPMVVEDTDKPEDAASKKPLLKQSGETKIDPPSAPVKEEKTGETPAVEEDKDESEKEPEPKSKPAKSETSDSGAPLDADKADANKKPKQPEEETAAAAQVEQDAKLQKIIDSKKYFLPINAVEQRRSKHFVVLGIILAILLALAWGDIAADAGLIHVKGIKPVTHFFSN